MTRMPRTGKVAALLAVTVGVLVPASATAGDGPVATKSGTLVNYVSGGKLTIGKKIFVLVVCSADCDVTSTLIMKGPGVKAKGTVSGPLSANVPGATYLQLDGPSLKALKAQPGRFELVNRITATDATTRAVESISRTFKFKRA